MGGRLKTYFSSFWQCGRLPLAAYGKDRCLFDKHSLLGFGQAFNGDIFIHSFNGDYPMKIKVLFSALALSALMMDAQATLLSAITPMALTALQENQTTSA